jgi:hypothetical protein
MTLPFLTEKEEQAKADKKAEYKQITIETTGGNRNGKHDYAGGDKGFPCV